MNRGQQEQLKKLITLACHGQGWQTRTKMRTEVFAEIPKHEMTASLIHSEIFW